MISQEARPAHHRVYGSFDEPPFTRHDDAPAAATAAEIESIHLRNYSVDAATHAALGWKRVNFKGNIMRMKEGNFRRNSWLEGGDK